MSPLNLAVDVLLAVGVGAELLCVLGLLLAHTTYDRLYFTGVAAVVGPAAIGAAIVMRETVSPAGGVELTSGGLEVLLAALFLFALNPVLGHATARAAERGTLAARAKERAAP
ncbi:MAG TPA: monovalent cation/H(+) antiporter subunit G [Gaiellaceae bacterium]